MAARKERVQSCMRTLSADVMQYRSIVRDVRSSHNVRELIELAKKRPGEISYGTSGIGGVLHISILLLEPWPM